MQKTIAVPSSSSQRKKRKKQDLSSLFLRVFTWSMAAITILILVSVLGYILISGIPNLKLSLFEWTYTSENHSMMPAILNTIVCTGLSLLISVPVGVGGAVYLNEYAKKGSRIVQTIMTAVSTLAGVPSIVFGLFGMLLFVQAFHLGLSILSGSLTLSIMVLPVIIQTTREALQELPSSWREGAFALGAGKARAIFDILLPGALPGILTGILLAAGRMAGESAALIYTAGTLAQPAFNILEPGSTLSVFLYKLTCEGLFLPEASACAVVLVVMSACMNAAAGLLEKKAGRKLK